MSFYAITISFLTHSPDRAPIHHKCRYGDNLETIISGINDYRDPENQITQLYTLSGKQVPRGIWKAKLIQSDSYYIDM